MDPIEPRNRCYTYFAIRGLFDPDDITRLLGLQPYESCRVGDPRKYVPGTYDFAGWYFGLCEDYDWDVSHQMEKTIAPLLDKIDLLNQIREKYDAHLTLEVVPTIYPISDDPTPCLSPSMAVIDFCHDTRTEIDTDMYVWDSTHLVPDDE